MAMKIMSHADAVARSREKTGAKPVAITMKEGEIALLDRLAKKHGGRKAAVMAGLRALEKGAPDPTPEEALRVIERALKRR